MAKQLTSKFLVMRCFFSSGVKRSGSGLKEPLVAMALVTAREKATSDRCNKPLLLRVIDVNKLNIKIS